MHQITTLISLFLTPHIALAALVYQSQNWNPQTARVVVAIHGCLQSSEAMSLGSGWNSLADKNNLLIIYPQVPANTNALDCWSWYDPENQKSTSGQLFDLHEKIKKIKKQYKVSKAKTFVTGISSGAAVVNGLLSCFPDSFAAGASHSGPVYGSAQNAEQAVKVLKEGPGPITNRPCSPHLFTGKILVLHGDKDTVVNIVHAEKVIDDFLSPEALKTPPQRQNSNGLSYTVTNYIIKNQLRGRLIIVDDLEHAWSGYNLNLRHPHLQNLEHLKIKLPFFADKGPSATNLMWEFFRK